MENKGFHVKLLILNMSMLLLLVVFTVSVIFRNGTIENLNKEVDAQVAETERNEARKYMVEGLFVDRDGECITEEAGPGQPAQLVNPAVYSPVIGYNSVYQLGTSGLRTSFQDYLFNANAEEEYKGQLLRLTLDNQLMEYCYELLGSNVGSIIVLENATGDILASVSRNDPVVEYDANHIEERFEEYKEIPNFFYNLGWLGQDAPGSTGKILTACALVENGKVNFVHDDNGKFYGIDNAGGHYGPVGITKGMVKSVNTYFAAASQSLGIDNMTSIYQAFGLGEEIPLEFTTLKSSFELLDDFDLRQSGFGQGKLKISPLHLTMILSTIINDGNMLEPHILYERYRPGSDELLYTREVKCLKEQVVSLKTCTKLKQMLSDTAKAYKIKGEGNVYAKTGTCEVTSKLGKYHIYLLVATDQYSCCISIDRTNNGSGYLKPLARDLVAYLESNQWKTYE